MSASETHTWIAEGGAFTSDQVMDLMTRFGFFHVTQVNKHLEVARLLRIGLEERGSELAKITRERDLALENLETATTANAELVKRAGELAAEKGDSDRQCSHALEGEQKLRTVITDGRALLDSVWTELNNARQTSDVKKGPGVDSIDTALSGMSEVMINLQEAL